MSDSELTEVDICPHNKDCPFRSMLDSDPDLLDKMYGLAQQIRYIHRTASALAGLLSGIMETVKPGGELNGTARISVASLEAAQKIANRLKDKGAVAAQIVVFIGYLAHRKRLWDQLDDHE